MEKEINKAITTYGYCIVEDVLRLVNINGVDEMLILFTERKMEKHLSCFEDLYL